MLYLSTIDLLTAAILLVICSYVSFRTVKAVKRSYGGGIFRNFANTPITYLLFSVAASPFLLGEKLILFWRNSPGRRTKINNAEFMGNKQSLVFHQIGCEYAEVMGYDKRIALKSVEDAKKKGYRPCATCKPN